MANKDFHRLCISFISTFSVSILPVCKASLVENFKFIICKQIGVLHRATMLLDF